MDRKGQTLVELMVVVAILVSVSAVLAVNVMKIWARQKVHETELVIGQVEQGLHAYAAVNRGRFPTTVEGLAAVEPYLSGREPGVPNDAWGNAFRYRSPDGEALYSVRSLGPDGVEGGGDDVVVELF